MNQKGILVQKWRACNRFWPNLKSQYRPYLSLWWFQYNIQKILVYKIYMPVLINSADSQQNFSLWIQNQMSWEINKVRVMTVMACDKTLHRCHAQIATHTVIKSLQPTIYSSTFKRIITSEQQLHTLPSFDSY